MHLFRNLPLKRPAQATGLPFIRMASRALPLCVVAVGIGSLTAQTQDPNAYTDPATGHRVVRLSRVEGKGSSVLYFHQNVYTAAGDKMVFHHDDAPSGQSLYSLDIADSAQLGNGKTTLLVDAKRLPGFQVVGPKSREVFYIDDGRIDATNLDTRKTRTIATLPSDWDFATQSITGLTLNSDETLLAGADTPGAGDISDRAKQSGGIKQNQIDATFDAHLPTFLFTVDVRTGKINVILKGQDWFDHVQFSPTDPTLLMFAHEGPWKQVDRIWLIRADGTGLVNFHPRTNPNESIGHEFWDPGGRMVWYDDADGKTRSLVGQDLATGKQLRYRLQSEQLSVHYNISHDGKLFAGDGATYDHNTDPMVQLLIPQPDGTLRSEKLASMKDNDYKKCEPNVRFSPDDQWVIYTSTQSGQKEVYAARVAK